MYYEPGYGEQEILCYRAYDKNFDKTYTSADGTLVLDGFRNAEFTDGAGDVHRGNYTLSTDNKIVYMDAGTQRYTFDISATLILTDGVYGTYAMYAGDEWWDVTFDGLGNATAASRLGHRSAQGMYIVEREDEVMLFINIEPGVNSYRLQLFSYEEHGEAFVFDEDLEGAYVGDDWTVLLLDGYGSGAYYFPDGSGMTAIYYSVLDEEIGYINIRTESMIEQNLILNTADKTMAYPSYADRRYVYYGEDLSALIIDPSGEIFMDYTSGYYIFMDGSNGVYRAYLMDENAEYHAVDLGGKLGADVFELGGKKYYLSSSAQRVTLTGTVEVSYESTQSSEAASLTFTLTGEELVRAQGTFRVGEETYAVDLVNYFRDDTGYHGLAIVDWSRYEYSAFTEYTYGGNGTGSFKVVVAAQEMTMTDAFEQENGITSTLTEYRVGFGPINITSRKLSGHVFVGNGQYLDFQDADIEIVYLYESDLGNRYNAVFTVNGTTYSIQYNKVEDEYGLYLLGTYETVETDGYTVGIIKYFYSNDAFNHDYAVGAFCDFILYKGTGEERTPVVAMSKMVNAGGLSGWYVDIGNYDPVAETGYPDTIYLLTFGNAQSSVTVEKYGFMQASEPDGTPAHSYCVNLCLENGQIKSIAAFNFDGVFYTVTSAVYSETEEGWIMTCTDGNEERTYLVTLPVDAEGNHLKNHDGNWQMTLEEYEAQ